jgi:hypothetical protein
MRYIAGDGMSNMAIMTIMVAIDQSESQRIRNKAYFSCEDWKESAYSIPCKQIDPPEGRD